MTSPEELLKITSLKRTCKILTVIQKKKAVLLISDENSESENAISSEGEHKPKTTKH